MRLSELMIIPPEAQSVSEIRIDGVLHDLSDDGDTLIPREPQPVDPVAEHMNAEISWEMRSIAAGLRIPLSALGKLL